MKTVFRWLIQFYRLFLSPLLGPRCRFFPSCSEYALEALEQHPLHHASWLIVKRLGRCQPWGGSGYDPVPPAKSGSDDQGDSHSKQKLYALFHHSKHCSCQLNTEILRHDLDALMLNESENKASSQRNDENRHRIHKLTPYTSQPRETSASFLLMKCFGGSAF
jgi:putative membrane protein insertion efficiency factor